MSDPTRGSRREQLHEEVGLSTRKKVLFTVIVVLGVPVLTEALLAVLGVRPALVFEDPYVGFQSRVSVFEKATNDGGEAVYRTAQNKLGLFNEQSFPVAKGADAYRIFCLGGSTTFGRPYDDATSFVGWLRLFIRAAAPDVDWEVINCGGVSYASYRVAALMEELIHYEPDLFIIYTGHNEFLERRTYRGMIGAHPVAAELTLWMYRSRLVSLTRSLARSLIEDPQDTAKRHYKLTGEVAPLLDTSGGLDLYQRDDELSGQITDHFRFNLGRMITLARSVGADVIFIRPAANLKDFSPFKSQHREELSRTVLAEWWDRFERGLEASRRRDHETARQEFEEALALDDRHAQLHYELGDILLAQGDLEGARHAYDRALVEDVCPLRMLPQMKEILESVARWHDVEIVDFEGTLEAHSRKTFGHPILGGTYFLDHLHPTIDVHRLLAGLILDHLISRGTVRPSDDWSDAKENAIAAELEHSLDRRDHARAQSRLARVLRWAGKTEEADRLITMAAEVLADDAQTLALLASSLKRQGKTDEAIEQYQRALQLEPTFDEACLNLGGLLADTGRLLEAIDLYSQVLRRRPNDVLAHRRLGLALTKLGQFDEAAEVFARAVQIEPTDPRVRVSFGEALISQGRLQEALAQLDAALLISPQAARALVLKGLVLAGLGRVDEAIEQYGNALCVDRGNAEAHYNLGVAHLRQRRRDRAIEHFEQALRLQPDLGDAHYNLGIAHAQEGDFARASVHLERAVEITPDDASVYLTLAMSYVSGDRFGEAIATIRRGLGVAPDHVGLIDRLAWILATCPDDKLRDGREARRLALDVCSDGECRNPRYLDTLAAAYAETGQFDKAAQTMENAVEQALAFGDGVLVNQLRGRLDLYLSGQPYRLKRHGQQPTLSGHGQ